MSMMSWLSSGGMARTVRKFSLSPDVLECECRMSVSKEWHLQPFLVSKERHLQLFSSISLHGTILKPTSFILRMTQALCSPTNSQYQFDLSSVLLWCLHCGGKVSSSSDTAQCRACVRSLLKRNGVHYIGEARTQNCPRVNAPSSSKYTTVIDSIGRYYF